MLAKTLVILGLLATPAFADEAKSPHFLVNGYPLGDARTHLDASETRAYHRALAAFPTAAACLKDGNDPKTAKLDLEAFSSLKELEVCLFLTADRMGVLDEMRALLGRSGFEVHPNISHFKSSMKHFGVDGEGIAVSARMETGRVPLGLIGLIDRTLFAYALSIDILFDPENTPIKAEAGVLRL